MRKLLYGIKNLIKWFPIIWKDRDWDYYYTMEILKQKLLFTARSMKTKGLHEKSAEYADQMETCAALIHIIQNETYLENLLKTDDDPSAEKTREAIKSHDYAKYQVFKIMEENMEKWWH